MSEDEYGLLGTPPPYGVVTSNADVLPERTTVSKPWSDKCTIPYPLMRRALWQLYNWWLEEKKAAKKGVKGKFKTFPPFRVWMQARLEEYRQYRQQEINEYQNDLNNAYREV